MRYWLFLFLFTSVSISASSQQYEVGGKFVFHKRMLMSHDDIKYVFGQTWTIIYVEEDNGSLVRSIMLTNHKDTLEIAMGQMENEYGKLSYSFQEYQALLKKYGLPTLKKILNGTAWLGMTKAQAKMAWGNPDDINTTVNS